MKARAALVPSPVPTASPPLLKSAIPLLLFTRFPRPLSRSLIPIRVLPISQSKRKNETIARRRGFGFGCECCVAEDPHDVNDEFVVVNFYRFVFVDDPQREVSRHLSFLQGFDIHGRIYLNEQGINAQYSGPSNDALKYVKWLKEDQRFADVMVQVSPAPNGHAFPRLKLRYKPSLVQLEGGVSHLPLLDPLMRATPLAPSEWRRRLETVHSDEHAPDVCKDYILLDVRNGYEWDIGHFEGSQRPDVDCFRSTSYGLSQRQIDDFDGSVDCILYS